jgi:hypothetical protein
MTIIGPSPARPFRISCANLSFADKLRRPDGEVNPEFVLFSLPGNLERSGIEVAVNRSERPL